MRTAPGTVTVYCWLALTALCYILCEENFDIVYPQRLHSHRSKRDLSTKMEDETHEDSLSIKIKSKYHADDIVLDLARNDENHPESLLLRTYDAEGNAVHDSIKPARCYYTGRVLNKRDSYAHISTCSGDALVGVVDDGEHVFDIGPHEPHGSYNPNDQNDQRAHRFAKADDLLDEISARYQNQERHYPEDRKKDEATPQKETVTKWITGQEETTLLTDVKEEVAKSVRSYGVINVEPQYLPYLTTMDTRWVEVFVSCDHDMWNIYKNKDQVVERVLNTIGSVDKAYQAINVRLVVVAIEIQNHGDVWPREWTGSPDLDKFTKHFWYTLSYEEPFKSLSIDTAMLLRPGGWKNCGGMANLGKICTTGSPMSISAYYKNSIAGSTTTIGHEFGHTMNMKDITNYEEQGCTCLTKRGCFMGGFKSVRPGFETCGLTRFKAKNYHCLSKRPGNPLSSDCGNGIREKGEECDCGTPEMCAKMDPCCEPYTCKLKAKAQCSRTDHCCTEQCTYQKFGVLCRDATNGCDIPERCTGASSVCPADEYKIDGSACGSGGSYCYNGACTDTSADKQCKDMWHGATCSFKLGDMDSNDYVRVSGFGVPKKRCVDICLAKRKTDESKSIHPFNGITVTSNGGCWCGRNVKKIEKEIPEYETCFLKNNGKATCEMKPGDGIGDDQMKVDKTGFTSAACIAHCQQVTGVNGVTLSNDGDCWCNKKMVRVGVSKYRSCKFVEDKDGAKKKCTLEEGDGEGGEEVTVVKKGMSEEKCIEECLKKSVSDPSINGLTVNIRGGCWCEKNMESVWAKVSNYDKYQSCIFNWEEEPTCSFVPGDGKGGEEIKVTNSTTITDKKTCIDTCVAKSKTDISILGVTWRSRDKGCYCEQDMNEIHFSPYSTCILETVDTTTSDKCWKLNDKVNDGYGTSICASDSSTPCKTEDLKCGQLQCTASSKSISPESVFFGEGYKTIDMQGTKCHAVKLNAEHAGKVHDGIGSGMVEDGTKCGQNKICVAQKCIDLIGPSGCENKNGVICSGQGMCSSKGACVCNAGFDPSTNCATKALAVNGAWGEWTSWGKCTKACDSGVRRKHRFCVNPVPKYGGQDCQGVNEMEEGCNAKPCVTDGRSCKDIKIKSEQKGIEVRDGIYEIVMANGQKWLPVYCDMTRNGGGWTLLVSSSTNEWTPSRVKQYNTAKPDLYKDYSILVGGNLLKQINKADTVFQYRLEAHNFGVWGGIWRAPMSYDISSADPDQTDVVLMEKFSSWSYQTDGLGKRLPYIDGARITTSKGGKWGSITDNERDYHPSRWIYGTLKMEYPEHVWYWLREGCEGDKCPVAGGWGAWSVDACDAPRCGVGFRRKRRACDSPAPKNDGMACQGEAVMKVPCEGVGGSDCPVSGSWGTWGSFTKCIAKCDGSTETGSKSRIRKWVANEDGASSTIKRPKGDEDKERVDCPYASVEELPCLKKGTYFYLTTRVNKIKKRMDIKTWQKCSMECEKIARCAAWTLHSYEWTWDDKRTIGCGFRQAVTAHSTETGWIDNGKYQAISGRRACVDECEE